MINQNKRRDARRKQRGPSDKVLFSLFGLVVVLAIFSALLFLSQRKQERINLNASLSQTGLATGGPESSLSTRERLISDPDSINSAEQSTAESRTERIPILSHEDVAPHSATVQTLIQAMSLEEKVAQLFIVTPEALTGEATSLSAEGQGQYQRYPVGGFIIMPPNIEHPEQLKQLLSEIRSFAKEQNYPLPLLAIDEEGGDVARIAKHSQFHEPNVGSMQSIGDKADPILAKDAGKTIASYLATYGFNVDFAPVADVLSNPENNVIGNRSFGTESQAVAEMVTAFVKGIHETGLACSLKHFPGHGATAADTHYGFAVSQRNLQELMDSELLPFIAGIKAGADFVMVGHFSLPELTGHNLPAVLSKEVITDLLRGKLAYQGLIITDAMNMGAISEHYSSGEAAVMAIQAGCDLILMPENFTKAYDAVLSAVHNGEIAEAQIDRSLARILSLKENLN